MQIVIDIPETQYNCILKSENSLYVNYISKECLMYAIKTGIPLQKDHGDLIDKSKLLDTLKDLDLEWIRANCSTDEDGIDIIEDIIEEESIIIEADKTERGR